MTCSRRPQPPAPIYLVRHGQTVWNRVGRLQGQLDSPLTRLGVEQALGYGRALRLALEADGGSGTGVAFRCSPLGRAWQTAALIADVLGHSTEEIQRDAMLAEHDVGAYSGKSWDEIHAEFGVRNEVLRDFSFVPPGGESRGALLERAREWLGRVPRDRDLVVVTHGGFSRALRGVFLGLQDAEAVLALSSHHHGRFYRLDDSGVEELLVPEIEVPAETLLG